MNPMQPIFMSPYPPPQQMPDREIPPARVLAAMRFHQAITEKTDQQIAINDISIEEFDGQVLEVEEKQAFHAACQLLTAYFKGAMELDQREQLAIKEGNKGAGSFIHCPSCAGGRNRSPQHKCPLCQDAGSLLVYPAQME